MKNIFRLLITFAIALLCCSSSSASVASDCDDSFTYKKIGMVPSMPVLENHMACTASFCGISSQREHKSSSVAVELPNQVKRSHLQQLLLPEKGKSCIQRSTNREKSNWNRNTKAIFYTAKKVYAFHHYRYPRC